ncbi:hypothetical protein ACFL6I_23755 [candidate division KSB1 bacterium]
MEDTESTNYRDDEEEEDEITEEDTGISFDDIVSFTMLIETMVTLAGIALFFAMIMTGFL